MKKFWKKESFYFFQKIHYIYWSYKSKVFGNHQIFFFISKSISFNETN